MNNIWYIKSPNDQEILTKISQSKTVFSTLEDLKMNVLIPLNTNHQPKGNFSFKVCVTEKYITLRCKKCSVFNFWFKNKDDIDMKVFMEKGILYRHEKTQEVMERSENYDQAHPCLNIMLFRSINQNHCAKLHCGDVEFDEFNIRK